MRRYTYLLSCRLALNSTNACVTCHMRSTSNHRPPPCRVEIPEELAVEDMGQMLLRGKSCEVRLFSLEYNQ